VHVEYRRANQVYEDVLGNVVDIGLVAYPTRDAKLEIVPLRREPMVLIVPPTHALAKTKTVKIKELSGQRFISFEPDIPTRRAIDKLLREHGVTVNHAMEFDNIETVKRAVEIEAGIAIVPRGCVSSEIARNTLIETKIEDADMTRPLAALYKKHKVLSPAMRHFLATLKGETK
jgi:DNA-binding transcriptional LysR family regulator